MNLQSMQEFNKWVPLVAVQKYLLHHSPFKLDKKLCTVHIGRPLIKRSAHIPWGIHRLHFHLLVVVGAKNFVKFDDT